MKFQHFFKVHQISSNLQNIFESSSETCMWNLSPFREVDLFHRKMHTVPAFEISWNFNIFPKFTKFFIKLAEHIGIIIRNMHVKFEPFQGSYIFSQKNADSARARNIIKFQHFFQSSPTFIIFAQFIWIIIRNMHVEFEPIQRSYIFHRKMLTVPALEISWNFNIFFKAHQI